MSDDLIRSLQREWQAQECDVGDVLLKLRRARWTPHLVFALEVLGCCLALGVGVWFAWVAAHTSEHKVLFAVSALVLLTAVPALAIATVRARLPGLAWEEETPESILRIGIRRADASLAAMRVGRWHIVSVVVFVALLWVLQWLEYIDALGFLLFYSASCFVGVLGCWFWMARRARALRADREACERLLSSLSMTS